jgi:hypothetical protein
MLKSGLEYFSVSDDILTIRHGFIEFDETTLLAHDHIDQGPLHVEHGIHPDDIAIMIDVVIQRSARQRRRECAGYWVTEVESYPPGGGVLVGTDIMARDPDLWSTGRLYRAAEQLGIPADVFLRSGITGLKSAVRQRRRRQDRN